MALNSPKGSSFRCCCSSSRTSQAHRLAMLLTSLAYGLPRCFHHHSFQSYIVRTHCAEPDVQQLQHGLSRPLPKRLIPIPIGRQNSSDSVAARPSLTGRPIIVSDSIRLTDVEFKIFTTLKAVLVYYDLRTQLRVAGGWVRDKLLGKRTGDIDIALDDMLGKTFCRKLLGYFRDVGIESNGFGVIRSNPMQAKHLEVARMEVFGVMIDFVNLRPAGYTGSNSIHSVVQEFGTAVDDAFRRDFTMNSLFYNINAGSVEDPTGKGLSDLRVGIIATPLPAKETFMDDPLRALRALRFVATLDYELHPEAMDAIDADIKHALATKISRERIGAEVDRIFGSDQPLKAMEILIEKQLFPIVFKPPSMLNFVLPHGIERRCLHALHSIFEVVNQFGRAKLSEDHRKRLYFAAFLSPMRMFDCEYKDKLVHVSTVIMKETLKLRSVDAAMVRTLHETAGSFIHMRKLLLKMDAIVHHGNEMELSRENIKIEASYSYNKNQIEKLLLEMRGLWRSAMLLATILEDEEALLSMPYDKRKMELIRRSNVCIYIEETLVKLGLDKVKGPNPFIYKLGTVDHG